MLIRIKTELSSFKTLGGDMFGDFLKNFENVAFFSRPTLEIFVRTKKLRNFILFYYTKFPNTGINNEEFQHPRRRLRICMIS